jgi:CTP synthase (UTP-ammonia lyase)
MDERPDTVRIGLVGDHDPAVTSHRAIPLALARAAAATGIAVEATWLHTAALAQDASPATACDGLWCVPASPYSSADAAIAVIRHARETALPFLGTCGGYQHALLEYARNVLGLSDARHAEEDPGAGLALIGRLSCDLVEVSGHVRLTPGSRLATLCGGTGLDEEYHCRFGLDPRHRPLFDGGPLRIVGEDAAGEPRAFELDGHPFYFGTAFQPERSALADRDHPLIVAFVRACAEARVRRAAGAR